MSTPSAPTDARLDPSLSAIMSEPEAVQAPAAWFVKVTTNLCLNRLGSARSWRERYVGPWLRELVLTSDGVLGPMETAEQRDTVSLGFLVLAERLTPGERAVFVLHEAFGYSHRGGPSWSSSRSRTAGSCTIGRGNG